MKKAKALEMAEAAMDETVALALLVAALIGMLGVVGFGMMLRLLGEHAADHVDHTDQRDGAEDPRYALVNGVHPVTPDATMNATPTDALPTRGWQVRQWQALAREIRARHGVAPLVGALLEQLQAPDATPALVGALPYGDGAVHTDDTDEVDVWRCLWCARIAAEVAEVAEVATPQQARWLCLDHQHALIRLAHEALLPLAYIHALEARFAEITARYKAAQAQALRSQREPHMGAE